MEVAGAGAEASGNHVGDAGMSEELDQQSVEALKAISVLSKYLAEQWIAEGCRTNAQWGCASCEAVELDRKLQMLAADIRFSAGIPIQHFKGRT